MENNVVYMKPNTGQKVSSKPLIDEFLDKLARNGVQIEDNQSMIPHIIMVEESIQAFFSKLRGEYHPLHDIAEDIFKQEE